MWAAVAVQREGNHSGGIFSQLLSFYRHFAKKNTPRAFLWSEVDTNQKCKCRLSLFALMLLNDTGRLKKTGTKNRNANKKKQYSKTDKNCSHLNMDASFSKKACIYDVHAKKPLRANCVFSHASLFFCSLFIAAITAPFLHFLRKSISRGLKYFCPDKVSCSSFMTMRMRFA